MLIIKYYLVLDCFHKFYNQICLMWQIVKCHGGPWAPAASRRCWGRVVACGVFPAIPSRLPTLLSLPQTLSCQYLTSQSIGLFAILTSLLWQFVDEKHDSTLLEVVVVAGVLGRLGSSWLQPPAAILCLTVGGRAWQPGATAPVTHRTISLIYLSSAASILTYWSLTLPCLS